MLYGNGLIDDTFHIDVDLSYEHLDWKTTYMIEATTTNITYNTEGAEAVSYTHLTLPTKRIV